jgi:hypothetical protein
VLDEVKGYAVRCDACQERIGPAVPWRVGMTDSIADVARKSAAEIGWKRDEGHDLCPSCAKHPGVR